MICAAWLFQLSNYVQENEIGSFLVEPGTGCFMFMAFSRLSGASKSTGGLGTRVEGCGDGGNVDGLGDAESGGDEAGHGGSGVAGDGLGGSSAGVGSRAGAHAVTSAEGVVALVDNGRARLGPDVDAGHVNVLARNGGSAEGDHGTASGTVGGGALPVGEGQVLVLDTVASDLALAGPGRVDLEGVGVAVADEVLELGVLEGTITTVVLDHEHLVGVGGVDVAVVDVGDGYKQLLLVIA